MSELWLNRSLGTDGHSLMWQRLGGRATNQKGFFCHHAKQDTAWEVSFGARGCSLVRKTVDAIAHARAARVGWMICVLCSVSVTTLPH